MSGVIFLRQGNKLVEMRESQYDSEDMLQRLLAEHPNLIAGEQVNSAAPRRWLLVRREAGIPGEEGGYGRWSADHLFLDQDGIPTIVEVKRSADTRIRREVVGQMLDYAANAVAYWPIEHLQAWLEEATSGDDASANEAISELLESDGDITAFWQQVKTNLQAGRIRMVFVADVIPPELRRIIEFLNGQMNPAEVIGVEVRQYVGLGQQALVPRVVGQTQQAIQQKAAGTTSPRPRKWNEASFLQAIRESHPEEEEVVEALLNWAKSNSLPIGWGTAKNGSFYPRMDADDKSSWPFAVHRNDDGFGRLVIEIWRIIKKSPFDSESGNERMLERLGEVLGYPVEGVPIAWVHDVPLSVLSDQDTLLRVLDWLTWVLGEVRDNEHASADESTEHDFPHGDIGAPERAPA